MKEAIHTNEEQATEGFGHQGIDMRSVGQMSVKPEPIATQAIAPQSSSAKYFRDKYNTGE